MSRSVSMRTAQLLGLVTLAGCQSNRAGVRTPEAPKFGSISVRVNFLGDASRYARILLPVATYDAGCGEGQNQRDKIGTEDVLLDAAPVDGLQAGPRDRVKTADHRTIRNTVVSVIEHSAPRSAVSTAKRSQTTHEFTFDVCQIKPHVAVVHVDDALDIVNLDGTEHEPRFLRLTEPKVRTLGPYRAGPRRVAMREALRAGEDPNHALTFFVPREPIQLVCEKHRWERAYIHLVDDFLAGVSDRDGLVTIDRVPAGDVVLDVWHEKFMPIEIETTVRPGVVRHIEITWDDEAQRWRVDQGDD